MDNSSILTSTQKIFLKFFGQQKQLSKQFYLTGGTALTGFYIPYRLSEDLDFFSEQEIVLEEITVFIRSIKDELGFQKFEFNTTFNRNLFFLAFPNSELKLEFTYFPFPQLEVTKMKDGIRVDSVLDIAVNKLFTIYQKPRSRDFLDLYMIIKKYNFLIDDLIKKAKTKFDWHIDPIKLGAQFLLSKELKDYPKLLVPIEERDWQNFFEEEAKKLGRQIIDN
ncbi:MAG: nucleotidyl transferase AbiEii/AbiGii toxin family protein [Patescibacteria group bacterium]|nr:nucleotidyl transferase AbiEii/AbiGii toxin family protein [Patescibacteria group bacterium]